jgi:hypothetical protein
MGLFTSENQDTMKIVLKAFNDAAYQRYDNHSYSAGYLESVVVEMLAHTPKRYQKALIQSMVGVTQRLEKEVIQNKQKEIDPA